ncbi:BlaI/MecI/CopY family transcriptional regulator [Desulfococcaceae bacterium HSG7]|nr:BlaI/MecI/CopY family transcriptional regulator [Desulfococcaceae bacterium HSG9]MDM8553966.1 BlaI/MecI/CopY family transcriptional regulator [Desulfococcaceae bacterium HSG7]
MSQKSLISKLSRRERQIMDVVYKRGVVCAADMVSELPDKPSYSTVRKLMSILESKGYLYHEREANNRYIYHPVIPAAEARESALAHLLDTFFKGSAGRAAIALLKKSEADISEEEKSKIVSLIKESERKGR